VLLAPPLLQPDVLGAHGLASAFGKRLLAGVDEVDEPVELVLVLGQKVASVVNLSQGQAGVAAVADLAR